MKHRGKSPLAYRRLVFLLIALAINAMLMMWLVWDSYDAYGNITTMQQNRRVEDLRSTILHFDEILTMSARMAVLTGESEWEERYHHFEPLLGDAINEAKTLAPTAQGAAAAARTDAANVELVEMEIRAMKLLHDGFADEARALLFGDRYRQQKQVYAEGMMVLTDGLAKIGASDLSRRRRRGIANIVAGALMIPLIVVAWALAFSAARSWAAERARAEKSLQFQATLLDQIRDAVTATDMTGRITYINAAQAAWTGRTKEELIGRPVEIYGSDPARGVTQQELIDKTIQHGHWQGEIVNYAKDGTESLLHLRTWLIRDEDGNPTGLAGTGRDITEIKQAQYELQKAHDELEERVLEQTGQLRESEERYRTLFESSRDAIMTLAPPSWRFTSGNRATVEMFGAKDEEELISLGPWELSPEFQPDGAPSADKARQMIETAVREGSHLFDWTHKRVGGEEFPATVLLTRMELGGQTLLQATVRDITDRVEAEQALRGSEAGLKQAQQLAHVGSWEWDLADDSITLTDEMRHIYGLTEQDRFDDIFALVDAMVHPDNKEVILSDLRALAAGEMGKVPNTMAVQIVRPDGHVRWIVGTAPQPRRRDADGKPTVMMGTVHDITELKMTEESLKAAHRRLMFAGERERRAVARELHDSLGQQTIGMHLAIESILAKAKASGGKYVEELGSLSKTCQMLANEIRAVCYGLYPPALEALGLCPALRQLGRESEHALTVEVTCAPCLEETRLSGDVEIALFRIGQEAIANALRHSQAKTLTIDIDREGDDVILTVADDGVGFDTQQAESSGLGLRTMHERADAVGGELQITSHPGQTRVTARVPGRFPEMQT
ncbi:hypothetical protein LCGC14_0274380 [marine sediment metagenome]|uniref:histidine kinase n=1 Tax=marine sediment metagenome TaxID=412755 RepID=A0A0F9WIP1_9ZZZZ|nr:PAS domain-containing sensor histidine kinase [Phycisphaerae bacterium]HDZ43422.1 PAS domain-containing sensor histidine kinase [Phycisphaerae bacterium]